MRSGCLALTVLSLLAPCCNTRTPDTFYIPRGYVGWVRIEHSAAGAPPLEQKDGHRLIRIPSNGRLRTSSPLLGGLADDRYYYVDSAGKLEELEINNPWSPNGRIRARHSIFWVLRKGKQVNRQGHEFFVGSAEEYKESTKNEDWLWNEK